MKTIFTLLLAAGTFTMASAQSNRGFGNSQSRPTVVVTARTSTFGIDSFSEREKNDAIRRINREYDQKISMVKWDRRLRPGQKQKEIRLLEKQRNQEIRLLEKQRNQEIRLVQLRFEQANRRNRGWGNRF